MKRKHIGASLLLLAFAALMSADDTAQHLSPDGYAYGLTTCLQGSDGQGVNLHLTPHPGCLRPIYPYLEIHIRIQSMPAVSTPLGDTILARDTVRAQPIPINQKLLIGDKNSALRCVTGKSACEWSTSGEFMFNEFEKVDKKGIHTSGWYELQFPSGLRETGRFTVDCVGPCA
jgi:hypothetical protein